MTKAVGLITEYNPFHNGHLYHLRTAKQTAQADIAVVVMSGNFVQRGEPALADKWTRTKWALAQGADIVIELPFMFAVQPSHIFARGAIQLLDALQVSEVVFGAEHVDADFASLAEKAIQLDDEARVNEQFKRRNQTFASAYAKELAEVTGFELNEPNDILAFGYHQAVQRLGLKERMQLTPIKRQASQYTDTDLPTDGSIASASAIRQALADGQAIDQYVPDLIAKDLSELPENNYEQTMFDLLKYRVQTDTIGQIRQTYQMSEGLEHLFKKVIDERNATDFASLIGGLKSKRFTYARLHRTLLYLLLNIKVDQMQAAMQEPYLRLLGYSAAGQSYLNEIKKEITLPMITHVDRNIANAQLRLDYKAGQIYNILMNQTQDQDLKRIPLTESE